MQKTISKETRLKMSLAAMGNKNCLGYKHSEESLEKMRKVQKGHPAHPNSGFQKGHKGIVGKDNKMWKGNKVGYGGLHYWISLHLGKPNKCEHCGTTTAKKFEWCSVDHQYKRNKADWLRLCTSCHRKYDIDNNNYQIGYLTQFS